MSQPKWKKASYSSIQVKDTSLSAKTGTIKKLRSTDIDVSTIHGSNSIGVSTNINDTSYNTSKYSALTISAEAIQYQGGGKPENITVGGKPYEQYIQPLIFENKAGISTIKARGALAHLSEIDTDSDISLSAFGLFSAPNENLILTVAQDNGIFDYIDGSNSNYIDGSDSKSSLSYTKTGIFIDKSNRIFMGISGEDLTSDKLDYLVKGNKQAQLYVKGDIVVDGSGVQIDKYIVDDILVGESVAIMGNRLEPTGMVNDISAVVPDLEKTLSSKEDITKKQGYLMVANNTYLYSDLIFPTSDVSNSTDKITGSIQFHDPSGETICSISAFNDDKLLDISGSDNINMHSANNIDISSANIQMYGTDKIDISSGTIQMYGTDISMQSINNIDISSENIQLIVSSQPPQPSDDGTANTQPISNSITYSYSATDASMALAIINVGQGNTPGAYTDLLNEPDSSMAIPTVNFVKSRHYWKEYDSETATLNNDVNPDISNIYVPGNVGCNTLACNTLSVPEHFVTICVEVTTITYPWYFFGFIGEEVTHVDCVTVAEPNTTQITDFSSNIFVHGVASMLYTTPSGETSLTKGGLAVFPQDEGSAGMSVISHRLQASDAATATIFFGDALGSQSSLMSDTNIGAIRGEIDGSGSNRNMRFYGSDASSNLVNFMSYLGGDTSNMLDISAGNVSITLDGGVITKSTYTTETDPSNSLVDLSFVLNHVSDNATYWVSKSSTSNPNLSYIETKSTSKPVLINYHDQTAQIWSNQIFGLTVKPDQSNTNDGTIAVISSRNIADPSTHAGAVVYLGNYNDAAPGNNPHPPIGDNSGTYLLGGIRGYYPDTSDLSNIGNVQLFGSNDGTSNYVFMEYDGCNNKLDISSGQNINMQSTNNIDISSGTIQMSAADVSFNLSSSGHIYKSTYSQESDPRNSLVDLSFVLNHVSGNATYWENVPDASNAIQPKDSTITTVHGLSFNATSDAVKKENIRTISGALESIDHLRGVTYNLKADETQKTHHGVIAQEIEQIFPDMVAGTEGNKSVAYMEIIGVLIEAVKDLKTRVEELENK